MLLSMNTLKRLRIVSMLSSARPSLRPSSRSSITFSGQSKKSTPVQSMPISRSQASRFSWLRGKPSMRNLSFLAAAMAPLSSPTVTSLGTICPCFIISATALPSAVPLLTCARRRSPAERCVYPKSRTMLAHWVPLPEPGPPRTNTTRGLAGGAGGSSEHFTMSLPWLVPLKSMLTASLAFSIPSTTCTRYLSLPSFNQAAICFLAAGMRGWKLGSIMMKPWMVIRRMSTI
mmetsp:Transcript_24919/g.78899  ORF Transcript_24919/g.78899 Transcript_24919/m.78899 type:complete len:231 (-) Transcript_24919:850-1542(-)